MIQLAIWYLRKRNVQLIINIDFLEPVKLTGAKHNNYNIHDCKGEDIYIIRRR